MCDAPPGFEKCCGSLHKCAPYCRARKCDDPRLEKEPKLAVVLGTEGDGLANTTIEHCDYTVKIPMSHGVDSLNVAAASAVAFYQLGTLHNNV